MTDVDRLLSEYIEEHRKSGAIDPARYLEQLQGVDRVELEALIDGFLEHAPRRPWSAEAYAQSSAAALVDRLDRTLHGASGRWPTVLPALRDKAKLRRNELVKRLATALGVEGREKKVETYYHQMEQGLLPAQGVSSRVLEALGEIVGASAEALRRAGQASAAPPAPASPGVAFARTAPAAGSDVVVDQLRSEPADEPWDDVDQLFRGG